MDETAVLTLDDREDHRLVLVMLQWPVGPAERSDVVSAYNRNAMRLPPVRKAIIKE